MDKKNTAELDRQFLNSEEVQSVVMYSALVWIFNAIIHVNFSVLSRYQSC